jgi:biopolymer transport protein ExbD
MKKLLFLFLLAVSSSCAQSPTNAISKACNDYFHAFSKTKQSLVRDGFLKDTTGASFYQLALQIQSPNELRLKKVELPELPKEGLFTCTGTTEKEEEFGAKLIQIFDRIEQSGDLSPMVVAKGFTDLFSEKDWEHPFVQHGFLSMINQLMILDPGIDVKLPPWSDEEPDLDKVKDRNIWTVKVDDNNQLFIREKQVKLKDVQPMTKAFISNPEQKPELAESPKKAIVALRNERGTNYKTYLDVYNALKAAYDELWEEKSRELFDKSYEELSSNQKKEVRTLIPFVISEAEPTDFD